MARKNSSKQGNRRDFFDQRTGRVLADLNFADRGTCANLKSEIAFIREAFPRFSKEDITLVLQSCDCNVETAIACFTNGEAEKILKEWNTQGKKSKNDSSTKKNKSKKRQTQDGEPCSEKTDVSPRNDQRELQQDGLKDATRTSEDFPKNASPTSTMTLECPSSSQNSLYLPSPASSDISLPSSITEQPANGVPDLEIATKPSLPQDNLGDVSPTHLKYERILSTGPDALKKTLKDLQRSSVSLPRFQLLLEEECEKSFKAIRQTFEELRHCLRDRESLLLAQMEDFKKQAVELLEQRQENAAALKLKSERVGGMTESDVTQLRNEIKNFVTERKIDEELAKTTRFVGDKEQLLTMIKTFGGVAPIKSCYSPVTLNPPSLPTKKPEAKPGSGKVNQPANTAASSVPTSNDVPAITLPNTDEDSVSSVSSHKALQEVAELHARLQAALEKQGLSSTGNAQGEQKQSRPDNRRNRPSSASQRPSHQQARSRRPQTAVTQGQQRTEQNAHHDRHTKMQSAEPKGPRRERNDRQFGGNSRRGNQHPSRNNGSNTSDEKKGTLKAESVLSSQRSLEVEQQQVAFDGKKSKSDDNDKAQSRQPELNARDFVQSGSKSQQPKGQRESGNRNRREERKADYEVHSERVPSKVLGEKSISQEIPVEKGPQGIEENTVSLEPKLNSDANGNTKGETKGNTSVERSIEKHETVMNGVKTSTGNSATELNVEKAHGGNNVINAEALPQRQDRGSRRRGPQKDRKGGPGSRPTPNRNLNGTKPIENGVSYTGKEENGVEDSGLGKAVDDLPHKKSPSTGRESKKSSPVHEDDEELDKANLPGLNGQVHVKELIEHSIGR